MKHSATQTANRWRSAYAKSVGGLSVCFSILLIELRTTPPRVGGLLGGLTPFAGGLTHPAAPDRQAAMGVTGVAM